MSVNNVSLEQKPVFACERMIELYINEQYVSTFLASPFNAIDLAVGSMLINGYIDGIEDIETISYDKEDFAVDVELYYELVEPNYIGDTLDICTKEGYRSKESANTKISLNELKEVAGYMNTHSPINDSTGGMHMAALKFGNEIIVREDIGRHNAVDKVIGAAVRRGYDTSECVLLISGRFSSDMLFKIAMSKIPIACSLKFPSDMGLSIARKADICLVGRILTDNPEIYSCEDRIAE